MSIQTEITRLQQAKSSMVTTLTNKGVTVPANAHFEDLNTSISNQLVKPTGSINITTNGTHDVTNYASAVVNAAKPEQTKTATPTTSQQTISPDDGYALSSVTVNAMPTGTMGTVSAAKSISGNTATITPSISAGTAGYNTHAAASGTAVTVSASELVSGNNALTASTSTQTGINVTNYATVSVAPTPSETKSTTVNGTVTPTSGKYLSSVTVNVPQAVPIEISTDSGMSAVLISANVGKCYKFTGTTGTYTNGDLYIVESV